jgi:K+-dependent Na+/Ca+ exchanger-like protein
LGNHIAAGNETTTAAPAMANISFPERCGGKVCKDLTLAERNGFCKSDLYPSDAELEAFRTPVVVGTLYEFYCEHYNYPPNYDMFVGCGALTCDNPALVAALPLVGMLYMFLGLAIICDEFFVPALEIMVEKYDVDDDVAGATFMAAGGSAPELFTAMVSTFVAPPSASDTGFGTIVGSAVFNVLFVIGACAIFSKGVLELSWWPLARDSTYYTVGLSVLAVFFGLNSSDPEYAPASMEWWECLVLLLLYIGYVVMMKYNRWMHFHIMKCHLNRKKKAKATKKRKETQSRLAEQGGSTGGTPSSTKISPKKPAGMVRRDSSRSVLLEQLAQRARENPGDARKTSLHFRAGVLHLMVSEKSLLETAGIHLVTKVQGDVRATFASVAGENKTMSKGGLRRLLQCMGVGSEVTDDQVTQAFEKLDKDQDGSIDWAEFKQWYSSSEAKIWADCDSVFQDIDRDGDGSMCREELVYLLDSILGREPSPAEVDEAWLELMEKLGKEEVERQENGGDEMSIPQALFKEWFAKSVFFEDRQKAGAAAEEEEQGCFPAWPSESLQAKLLYIVSMPLLIPIYCTTPDVNKARFEKYFLVTFVMAIVWIAVFACKSTLWRKGTAVVCSTTVSVIRLCIISLVFWGRGGYRGCCWSNVVVGLIFLAFPTDTRCSLPPPAPLLLSFLLSCFYLILPDIMVWLATVFGWVCRIPSVVMGLTLLAAGTSVPDLLSSIIVAMQGKGDMAVSSSIGSNIFDILVGLPLPWIIKSFMLMGSGEAYTGNAVRAQGLLYNILVLVLMLVAVISTIAYNDWKMTKCLGGMMFFLYAIFLTFALVMAYQKEIFGE